VSWGEDPAVVFVLGDKLRGKLRGGSAGDRGEEIVVVVMIENHEREIGLGRLGRLGRRHKATGGGLDDLDDLDVGTKPRARA
jgi:hypothetical protein